MTLNRTTLYYCGKCCYDECQVLYIVMLNVIMLGAVMVSVIMLNVVLLYVVASIEELSGKKNIFKLESIDECYKTLFGVTYTFVITYLFDLRRRQEGSLCLMRRHPQ